MMSMPIVSLISLQDSSECASNLLEAAQTLGFVYITSEGSNISTEKIDRMFQLSKKFFSSPREEKEKCRISADNKGWSSMHSETLDPQNQRRGDFKEAFNFGEFKDGKAQQPMPAALSEHEAELSEFADLCHSLCLKLLRLFAIALKIDHSEGGEDWFTSRHSDNGPSGSILRLLHYPSLPADSDYSPTLDIRAGAHSDYGSVTLLLQRAGEPGLEIHHPVTKTWSPVPVLKDAILVNIGDLLSYWTAGLLRSTIHRVTFPKTPGVAPNDRYSIVYFCHPENSTLLTPIPSEVVKGRGDRGANDTERTLTADDHLRGRLKATYGWK
ncbi:uncharacterized protein H6S33_008320 [Morchella sextelata]|uniref:uncharacterized protein n=1 Tax=Morchella sextelata TaxID=1174677 RepID=UPI001D0522C9|nr:uncharacterized protein H6S33_008320 [Morchella sextelata]KAH0602670.1 hypothetical protein H6S33_008320 [Morchella sextelata]